MKHRKRSKQKRVRKQPRRAVARPREVYVAIRKLLDTTNHIQARAAELENALEALREQERSKAVKELLVALRNSSDGDLLRSDAMPGEGGNNAASAIIRALVEAFSIVPIHKVGERITVKDGEVPDNLELDRSIADEFQKCVAVEVVSAGWSYKGQAVLKPVVRPVFVASEAASVA